MTQPARWKCEVCGYIHEGPAPPDTCPVCGVGADMFSEFTEADQPPARQSAGGEAWRCTICSEVVTGQAPPEKCPECGAATSLFAPYDSKKAPLGLTGTSEQIVVVGGGVAGVTAADYARRSSVSATITLIHKEPDLPYNRLNLTRLLAGEVDETALPLRGADWYASERIETVAGDVIRIDREKHEVELRSGRSLKYDRLLLTNGSHPFVPPIVGVTRDGVFSLRTRRDASRILQRARAGARCVCIGGGLLGLEVAGALARRGAQVTVLEGFEWLLPRQLAQPAADMLRVHTENLGIRVICGVQTEGITGDEEAKGVRIKDGEEIPADLVVLAAGVRPNSHLARQSGLEVRNGVVVDDNMRTSDDSIYAAGDVTEHRGVVYGLWPTAMGQGAVAGVNAIRGNAQQFTGVPPANQLKVLNVAVFSIGQFERSDASFRVFEHQTPGVYYRLVCRDGRLVGANLFGDNEPAGAVKTAIEEGRPLAECRSLLDRFPNLMSCVREETV